MKGVDERVLRPKAIKLEQGGHLPIGLYAMPASHTVSQPISHTNRKRVPSLRSEQRQARDSQPELCDSRYYNLELRRARGGEMPRSSWKTLSVHAPSRS